MDKVIFFDLGGTLGDPQLSPAGRLLAFHPYAFTRRVLSEVRATGHRLGIISNTGEEAPADVDAVLERAALLNLFDDLRVYSSAAGASKPDPAIFRHALMRARLQSSPDAAVYVGEDAKERAAASAVGMRVAPHPTLALEAFSEHRLQYARVLAPTGVSNADWQAAIGSLPLVPLQPIGAWTETFYCILSERALPVLANMQFEVDRLGELGLPDDTDLFLLRDDVASHSGPLAPAGNAGKLMADAASRRMVLGAHPEGIIVALPPDRNLGQFHFSHTRHGHTLKLTPTLCAVASRVRRAGFAPFERTQIPAEVASAFATIDAAELRDLIERYSGVRAVGEGRSPDSSIDSRHIRHPGNAIATDALLAELQKVCAGRLEVRQHTFSHRGRTYSNIEAELPGAPESAVTLITAHLDSTAAASPGYREEHDPAPGADDDASGVAAVLSIARRYATLPAHLLPGGTVRFLLFNAEEEGLVGSQAYARLQGNLDISIGAVFQMDMIGYNIEPPRTWEVHVGCAQAPQIEQQSLSLGECLATAASIVSPALQPVQIYRSPDPADGRSDHASFQLMGYPACAISGDFFAGPYADSPAPEGNVNYHKREDTFVDFEFAADLARAVAAASWMMARGAVQPAPIQTGALMSNSREIDTRKTASGQSGVARSALMRPPADAALAQGARFARRQSFQARAVAEAQRVTAQAPGFAPGDEAPMEFVPDPSMPRSSAGAVTVNVHQMFQGVPIFQMTRTVTFDPNGSVRKTSGNSQLIPADFSTVPKLPATEAILAAAKFLVSAPNEEEKDSFGQPLRRSTLEITGYKPELETAFPLPSLPAVFSKGPFARSIPAHLVIFIQPERPRLAWQIVLTFPDTPESQEKYQVLVAADEDSAEILLSRSTVHHIAARGHVFEFQGGGQRKQVSFPRPLSDYPAMPLAPLAGFPPDWVESDSTIGNSTIATLNNTSTPLRGRTVDGHVLEFNPETPDGDEQKLLNIFYYCNYMHDFLQILGFDEASGNFQRINFTNAGLGQDPVLARAHSGAVYGTANMATGPDGSPPVMNMGLVTRTDRHTAFDSDVVFHEYVHGLTNRLVGGRLDPNALDEPQSAGMGEGWSDYFALTIQSYVRGSEKVVSGDWVVDDSRGIRRAPYDDNYPFGYDSLRSSSGEEHDIGEIWCAALMSVTRRMRAAMGEQSGYRLAWQIVVDGLKQTPVNPNFLQARDSILEALDDLRAVGRLSAQDHAKARRAAWEGFAQFGMGFGAASVDSGIFGVTADAHLPPDLQS